MYTYCTAKDIKVPAQLDENLKYDNRSYFSTVIGLAFRKLDVFGYYKFVTAVKNINLLPNRDAIRQQNKFKFLSGFALKGVAGAVAFVSRTIRWEEYYRSHKAWPYTVS